MRILVANLGSTSFKYRLFDAGQRVLAQGSVQRIGQAGSDCADYDGAIARCLRDLIGEDKPLGSLTELDAVGFKAVHAGAVTGARLVDATVLHAIEEFAFLAPAHNPPYAAAMRALTRLLPGVPLVAVFETAFFENLDPATVSYAVPWAWQEAHGVRRYGFHGASHRWASERAPQLLGRSDLKHISCHLGGSSSVAAIRAGKAVDTSFGTSPQSGLPQHNRVGNLDVFAALHVMKRCQLTVDQMAEILSRQSGLAGLALQSGDVRDLSQAAAAGSSQAQLALDVFVQSVRHYLGAFAVKLGGIDVLTFSGGIGENSAQLRAAICQDLGWLGIELSADQNRSASGEGPISRVGSPVSVLVIPANEEQIVAREAARVVRELRPEAPA